MVKPARKETKLDNFVEIPRNEWPPAHSGWRHPEKVWRSVGFLVQQYSEECTVPVIARLTVCRTDRKGDRWNDGISWDDLQEIKRLCGFGNFDAVEIYPSDEDVVNVANMRHLWVLCYPVKFAWRKQ